MATPLPPDFKEFLVLLNSETIEYLLVGGFAVSVYGYPRPTGDLDVWIAVSPGNIAKVVEALKKFGFNSPPPTASLFTTPGKLVRMGVPPVRIELLNQISGVEFTACYARRRIMNMDGVPVSVIALEDLIVNKQAAGRHKDLNDLAELRRLQGPSQ